MTTAEERNEILSLVASGKLSATEAAELLAAAPTADTGEATKKTQTVNSIEVEEVMAGPDLKDATKKAKWLHVRVSDLNTGKRKVTVNIPLRLMKLGIRLGGAFSPELQELDVDELSHILESDGKGILVDVEDEDDGNHVQVYVD